MNGTNREGAVPLLHAGDVFPALTITPPDGEPLVIPDEFAGSYSAVLFTTGSTCRSCVEQLKTFQRAAARLARAGIRVVAVSAEDEATTSALIAKHGIEYPIGHSADVMEIAETTGAFVGLEPPRLHTTGFVLDPSGHISISVYSCGAFGQLIPDDVLELVGDLRSASAQP
jgi:peroxiredoxin